MDCKEPKQGTQIGYLEVGGMDAYHGFLKSLFVGVSDNIFNV